MRLLVLGGTGFLGPHFVDAALAAGHEVTLFNRGKRGAAPAGVETLVGDRALGIEGLDALRGRTWDACIDNCGYVPRLVHASAEMLSDAVDRYVFVSSISVYADTSVPGRDETGEVLRLPADEADSEEVMMHYGALKAACEEVVEESLPGRAMRVRPGLIVGPLDPTDRFTYWPARMDRGGDVLCPGDGSDPVQVIDARDLARWMLRCVERGVTGVFNATGPATRLTMREMLEACAAASGREDVRLRWTPWKALEAAGVQPWSDMPAWVPCEGEHAGFGSVSCQRAIAEGLTFRPIADTARDTLAWWRSLPAERRGAIKAGLSAEREREMTPALD